MPCYSVCIFSTCPSQMKYLFLLPLVSATTPEPLVDPPIGTRKRTLDLVSDEANRSSPWSITGEEETSTTTVYDNNHQVPMCINDECIPQPLPVAEPSTISGKRTVTTSSGSSSTSTTTSNGISDDLSSCLDEECSSTVSSPVFFDLNEREQGLGTAHSMNLQ